MQISFIGNEQIAQWSLSDNAAQLSGLYHQLVDFRIAMARSAAGGGLLQRCSAAPTAAASSLSGFSRARLGVRHMLDWFPSSGMQDQASIRIS
jgi:hypothetical protein